MKITSNVYLVGGPAESDSSDAAIYLVKSGNQAALIDAGTGHGTERVVKNIIETGTSPEEIKYIFLTHCHFDHSGGINELRKLCGCQVVAHTLAAEYLETGDSEVTAASWYGSLMDKTLVDIKVSENERDFTIGSLQMKFYHTPGHSPDSSVYTVLSDEKLILFGQDIHGPLNDILLSSRADYEKSLEFLISLDADILCEGHFGVFSGKENVKDFIYSYL